MVEVIIIDLLPEVSHDPLKSDVKRQKHIECVLTRNSKQYLGKAYTEKRVDKLDVEEVGKLLNSYEVKFLGYMVKSSSESIIRMCLMGACATLEISNQNA